MNLIFALELGGVDPGGVAEILGDLLESLIARNRRHLRRRADTPSLGDSAVRYRYNSGTWQDIPRVLATGYGDCKDLVAWRVAELREKGEHARAHVVVYEGPPGTIYHLQVRRAGGAIEDPSRQCGMREVDGVL